MMFLMYREPDYRALPASRLNLPHLKKVKKLTWKSKYLNNLDIYHCTTAHCNISSRHKSCATHRGCGDPRHHKTPPPKRILAWGAKRNCNRMTPVSNVSTRSGMLARSPYDKCNVQAPEPMLLHERLGLCRVDFKSHVTDKLREVHLIFEVRYSGSHPLTQPPRPFVRPARACMGIIDWTSR